MKLWRNILVMTAAMLFLASCSSNDNDQEKPFTVCPEELVKFFACEMNSKTRGTAIDTLFTEDDIEWFNVSTREIRFKKQDEQLFKKLMKNYHKEGRVRHRQPHLLRPCTALFHDWRGRGQSPLLPARLLPCTVHQRRAHTGKH